MQANSTPVYSTQQGPHPDLERQVRRALSSTWQRPFAEHSRRAFDNSMAWRARYSHCPLILDSGCGVGRSTRQLAEAFPESVVMGVDRSDDRLNREHGVLPDNALLVRADLVDFWRLMRLAEVSVSQHYLLYPNPYPKASQLKYRWQGHPVLPDLLSLGGRLEMRTNWDIYAHEFALAVQWAKGIDCRAEPFEPGHHYLTHFERKYSQSGHALWRVVAALSE